MFLKSLTLRGFKSFADKTTLELEPGIMVVVGPNGSGKSNLVDAVAWVLGAQGPRNLRGAKMDDVIFAGTPDRPALGRAEVSLTIDNSAGLLPIEFSEVTITRTLFRNGDSEYAINGGPCRLLDIQELLSDTGIGRQQHVIVGQGQIDAILNARPEDRRTVVEEAAGILKFRKRREKAERRLDATEATLVRLQDLLREVRRGLGPLERQADAARRHDGVVAELRAIRLHLLGHELAGLQAKGERLLDRARELADAEQGVQTRLRELDLAVLDAERALTDAGHRGVADALARVEALRERARGTRALLVEKRRGIERELAAAADEGVVETLVADAGSLRGELDAVAADERAVSAGLAQLEAAEREATGGGGPEEALRAAETRARELDAETARWRARSEALALVLEASPDGSGAERLGDLAGVAGPLTEHVDVEPGTEPAVATALGEALHAVVVEGGEPVRAVLGRVAAGDVDARLLVLEPRDREVTPGATLAPAGSRPLAGCVRARLPGLQAALSRLLAGFVLVEGDWRAALDLALDNDDLVVVTRAGDRLGGPAPWRLGGARSTGVTALDEARRRTEAAEAAAQDAGRELEAARTAADEARAKREELVALRREAEVRAAALEERRALLERRLADVDARLARDPAAKRAAERDRAALVARDRAFAGLLERLATHADRIDAVASGLRAARQREAARADEAGTRLEELRAERARLEHELAGIREQQQRREVEEAEQRVRLDALVERVRTEFDCEPAAALDAPAPEIPPGTTLSARARELERELRLMGPINPLALEEHDALRQRHDFLESQLDDVRNSRRELQRVIKAVDREIVTVFEAAFCDVREQFTNLFTTLFPGGSGRVFLSDPDDLLETGIEIEARPSGKNTRRLSLLSGGERSLTALAFLFAVFRARPSPFYLLDEVEAALDDVNLHRFLELLHEFREEAQLLVVSHQKRTMEAADCLYGVSMPPGGSSRVVSQRMTGDVVLT